MITEALISALGGGLLRAIPEVLSFFDKKNERSHELSMMDKQMALKKLESDAALALATEQHDSNVDSGLVNAFLEAQKGQTEVMGGTGFIAKLNASVRPVIAYWIFGLYTMVKTCSMFVAIKANPQAWDKILVSCWTSEDMAMLSLVLGFFFVSRAFLVKK
jgi:hypothetical protein